ncbi:hypothetical protein ACWGJW_27510, partial [Streptomyces nigrescens]
GEVTVLALSRSGRRATRREPPRHRPGRTASAGAEGLAGGPVRRKMAHDGNIRWRRAAVIRYA